MKKAVKFTSPVVLILCSLLIIGITALFCVNIFSVKENEVSQASAEIKLIKNSNPIDINKILKENTSDNTTVEMVVEEIDIEYTTEYRNNNELPSGTLQVLQEGRDGKQNVIIIKKYKEENLISEELVAENLIKASINKIVEIGTGVGTNNYIARVGDKVYVTSNLLSVRLMPDQTSEKVCTLKKNAEITIKEIEEDWFYISSKEQSGYIPKDCVTNINPKRNKF